MAWERDWRREQRMAERRDPTAATQNLRWSTPGHPMVRELDPESAIRQAFYASVFVYACTRRIAADVASCPIQAGPNPNKRSNLAQSSALTRLLGPPPESPNPTITAKTMLAFLVAQRITTGAFALEIETSNGKADGDIVRLWPLVVQNLDPIPSQGGMEYFSGFKYGKPGAKKTLAPWQVLYDWRPSLADFRQPESPLQSARLDIAASIMQSRYDLAFLRNDARPAQVVVYEAFENDEDKLAFQQQFHSNHQGPDNAGKTMFLEASESEKGVTSAFDVKQLGLNQRDAQMLQANQPRFERICIALGVPMGLLNASGRTFSNAGEEVRNYWEGTVFGYLGEIEGAINTKLAPRLDSGRYVAWFNYDHVPALRPPSRFQSVSPTDLVDDEIVMRDEVREEMGLEPLDQDALTTWTPAGKLLKQAQAAQFLVSAGYDREGVLVALGLPPIASQTPESATPPPLPALAAPVEQRETPEMRRAKTWRSVDATCTVLEGHWERAWRRLFAKQRDATIARLEGKRGRQMIEARDDKGVPDVAQVFDKSFWTGETADLAATLYELIATTGAVRMSDQFGFAFDVHAPYIEQFIQERANMLAGQVTNTTYQAIKDAIEAAVNAKNEDGEPAGEGIPQIADRIKGVFDEADTNRATTIARTEVISAYNGGNDQFANNLPADVVAGKEWIATQDSRTRDSHSEANGQAVAMGTNYRVGHSEMRYPGDPAGGPDEVINCRCTEGFLTPAEWAARGKGSIERRVALRLLQGVSEGRITADAADAALEATA